MSKKFETFQTPPTLSVTPASGHLLPKTPQKLRYHSRLSTPNVAVLIKSPMMSPIQPSSNRSLKFDSAKKQKVDRKGGGGENSFSPSPLEKSFHAPLNDHLDLKVVLKDFELMHLLPMFESKGITLMELSEMSEMDFIEMGIFQLHELDTLKRICNLLNDSQNCSF